MNWNSQQMAHYQKLQDACAPRSIGEAAALCFADCKYAPPASAEEIANAEKALGCPLPGELREVYQQSDGIWAHYGTDLIMPIHEVLKENERLRHSPLLRDLYMPFDHLLVFGGTGNGDFLFFPIRIDGSVSTDVFLWDHETDSRSYFANNLKDLFLRHATNLAE
jgi:hypothetical protein